MCHGSAHLQTTSYKIQQKMTQKAKHEKESKARKAREAKGYYHHNTVKTKATIGKDKQTNLLGQFCQKLITISNVNNMGVYSNLYLFFILLVTDQCQGMDNDVFKALMTRKLQEQKPRSQNEKTSNGLLLFGSDSPPANEDTTGNVRNLLGPDDNGKCWSSNEADNPNRYCTFDNTPRDHTFLMISCPDTKDDLFRCECTIGVGEPEDAPGTDTCSKCAFCLDGTLAFDCRNVADGSCIGRNCLGECVSSYKPPEDLKLDQIPSAGRSSYRQVQKVVWYYASASACVAATFFMSLN